jgi:cell pole-organizing protein PopZ
MEEILSSIRRIIAEEDDVPRPLTEHSGRPEPAGEDVLELTDRIDEPRPRPEPRQVEAPPPAPAQRPQSSPAVAASQEPPLAEPNPLVSSAAAASSTAALSKLARAATPPPPEAPRAVAGLTVEQLLVSMLEPMLKEWFDKNLPALVERIVEDEVKKLVRRAEMQ